MSGRLYTPSNGDEGREFEAKWCRRCWCDDEDAVALGEADGCRILADALAGQNPRQWVQDVPGGPLCTAFVERRGEGILNPHQAEQDKARYDALPRDPATGRPVIA